MFESDTEPKYETKIVKISSVYRSSKSTGEKLFHYFFINDDSIVNGGDNHFCLFLNGPKDFDETVRLGIFAKNQLPFSEQRSNSFVDDLRKKILNK